MAEENRRFPPPPPPRPIPPRPEVQNEIEKPQPQVEIVSQTISQEEEVQEKPVKKQKIKLNEQAQTILYFCGGGFCFIIALVCIILAIVL